MVNAAIKNLEFKLRARTPELIKKIYRVTRAMRTPLPSKTLPDELIRDCRLVSSRGDMLEFLPKGGRVAELGTYKGEFARQILDRNHPTELHVIDVDYSNFDVKLLEDARVTKHKGLTTKVLDGFPDGYFDWIYVDAGHSYWDALADAKAAAPKIKPGGFLDFNDFGQIDPFLGQYGVHRAVTDFILMNRWPMRFLSLNKFAMYDVAIQKPEG